MLKEVVKLSPNFIIASHCAQNGRVNHAPSTIRDLSPARCVTVRDLYAILTNEYKKWIQANYD